MTKKITKVQALQNLLKKHGGYADWKTIYAEIDHYYPGAKLSDYWMEGIRGVVYREGRYGRNFTVKDGVVFLAEE